jgi:ankyrin repeat protein
MEPFLAAIVEDDQLKVKKLLAADSGLATSLIDKARLYESGIVHWIYVKDTAMHLAAAGYRVEIIRLLLAAGADPNARANHRRSGPLHYAADGYLSGPVWNPNRQVKTIEYLLDAGAEINAQDKNGASPLHRAVRTRSSAAVKCLLKRGAIATMLNNPGSTPFHLAVQDTGRGGSGAEKAREAQREIIRTFLSVGLSPGLQDSNGKSVFDCARSDWIRDLLSENGT